MMRKALTVGLAVLVVLVMSAAVARPDERGEAAGRIEGTWLSVAYAGETPFIQFLHTFTSDGRTTLLAPFGPDLAYGAQSEPTANAGDPRVGCTGEWRPAGKRTFDVTMYCLWRQNPGVQPDRIRFKLTLDRSGKHLIGPFKYLYNDPVFPPGAAGLEGEYMLKSVRLGLVPLD
jgi:hypothetical protein